MARSARGLLVLVGLGLATPCWAADPTTVRGSNRELAQAIAEAELTIDAELRRYAGAMR